MPVEKEAHDPNFSLSMMVEQSRQLTSELNLPDDIIIDIYEVNSDWEFILKLDSLLEAAVRHVVNLSLETSEIDHKIMMEFVDGLNMRGRNSLIVLLRGSGCEKQEIGLIESVRILRNTFAHEISNISKTLIDVICSREDKSYLIKNLCSIKIYDENDLITQYNSDKYFLRFSIMHGVLVFLIKAYFNVVVKAKQRRSIDDAEKPQSG